MCSDNLLNFIKSAKLKNTFNSIVLVSSHSSPLFGELLAQLQGDEAVPIVHYSNLWKPPINYNIYEPSEVVLSNFGSQLVVIAVLDEETTRNTILGNALRLAERNPNINLILISRLKNPRRSMIARGLFWRCFQFGLLNVFLLTIYSPNEVFTYEPFDGFRLIKIKDITTFSKRKIINLNKYKFKIFKFGLPPKVILPQEGEDDLDLKGFVGNIVKSYIEKRNARIHYVKMKADSVSPYLDLIYFSVNKFIDFALLPVPVGHFVWGQLSYPIYLEENCVIVPVPKIIPSHQNLRLPFQRDVWLAVICGIFYCTIIIYIVNSLVIGKKDIWDAFVAVFSLIIGIPAMEPMNRIKVQKKLFYLPLFLFGFILSNLYLSFLTTFLTSPAYEHEINTLEDIYDAGLKIVAENIEKLQLTRHIHYAEYFPLLKAIHYSECVRIKETLDNSNALILGSDSWDFLDETQRYRNHVRFRKSKSCIYPFALAVVFQFDSPFVEDFNEHTLLIHQSGLFAHWKKQAFFEALWAGYVNTTRTTVREGPVQLSLEHMRLAFLMLIFGLIISIVTFFMENCLFRMFS
ncbi:unnamed protein product [Hermetia illucens]|uniref:Ionotropic receptor n=1 Tax=Hermetia illucens TaxID=343691 RepID=A0A7R8YPH9_HERIL|nr:unnamed protein product [Hermetia illucens]